MADTPTNAATTPAEATPPTGENAPTSPCGRLIRGRTFSLSEHNDVTIGSHPGCHVVIEGADSLHATLHWEDGGWVLFDDPAPMDTLVNGAAIQSRRLDAGDWLEIAGVRIRFDGERLSEIEAGAPVGLRVTARQMSVKAPEKLPDGREYLLYDISFEAAPGKFVAILGPSGCGKSTLIQRLAGFADYGGSLRLNGHEISGEKETLLPLLAYLPQAVEATFHEDLHVEEAMEDFSRVYLGGKAPDEWAVEAFKQVKLDWKALREKKIRTLSGGQKRRLALVMALQRNPQLLLLDEPTAGLDPAAEACVMEVLRTIAEQGRTVFCATHVLGNLDLCDEVLVLGANGRQAFYGTPKAALVHFGADGWLDVYRNLETGAWEPATAEVPEEAPPKRLPPAPDPVTFRTAFRGTFLRLLRGWSGRDGALLAAIPVLVAVVLAGACGAMFGKTDNQTVCFCMAVAVFWMGLSHNVQGFVKERIPKRGLDRMRGMPLTGYFAAHAVHALATAVVQTVLFTLIVFGWRHGVCFSACALPAFVLALSLTAFAGGCVGLFVSACSKKELRAVSMLPLVAILALFLSKPVLEQDGEPTGGMRKVERLAPTFHAQECLYGELSRYRVNKNPEPNSKNWQWFLGTPALLYPCLFLPLAFLCQKHEEEKWDGR